MFKLLFLFLPKRLWASKRLIVKILEVIIFPNCYMPSFAYIVHSRENKNKINKLFCMIDIIIKNSIKSNSIYV